MALVRDGLISSLTLTVADNNGKNADSQFYIGTAADADLPAILTVANTIRDAYVPLTNGQLVRGALTVPLLENAPGDAPPPESEVERKLEMLFRGPASRYTRYLSSIPSPVFTLETQGTDAINLANPLIVAFANAVFGAVVTNRAEALTTLVNASIVHRFRKANR